MLVTDNETFAKPCDDDGVWPSQLDIIGVTKRQPRTLTEPDHEYIAPRQPVHDQVLVAGSHHLSRQHRRKPTPRKCRDSRDMAVEDAHILADVIAYETIITTRQTYQKRRAETGATRAADVTDYLLGKTPCLC